MNLRHVVVADGSRLAVVQSIVTPLQDLPLTVPWFVTSSRQKTRFPDFSFRDSHPSFSRGSSDWVLFRGEPIEACLNRGNQMIDLIDRQPGAGTRSAFEVTRQFSSMGQ